jgi:Flp pilus assembly protein TadG
MTGSIERTRRFITGLWNDTRGIILPYAALLLTVFIGLSALALDTGRQLSLQTQMQAAADAMAIAGARELDQRDGSRARAAQAMANLVSNGLTGMGSNSPVAVPTPVFFSSLLAASTGFGGTAATGDRDALFVAVTVAPKTVPAIFSVFSPTISAGAQAIAGHTADQACGIAPVFICNPYEQSGDSDLQATQRLVANLDPKDPAFNIANLRKLIRWKADNTNSPGHFGWLQPTDTNCNSTTCLNKTMAYDTKAALSGSCFTTAGVRMATGNKPIGSSMNDRFDIYSGNGPSALFSPAINVRKGFTLTSGTNWCSNKLTAGDYLTAQFNVSTGAVSLAPATTNVTLTGAPSKKNGSTTTTITVASAVGIVAGMSIASNGALGNSTLSIAAGTTVGSVAGTTITLNKGTALANYSGAPVSVTFQWLTTGLPLDRNWTGICDAGGNCLQGDGNWDCLNYWKINHGAVAPPAGCTATNPTVSRYDIYNAENLQAAHSPAAQPPVTDINDWSGVPQGVKDTPGAETGAPMCAISQGFTPVWDSTFDQRILYSAIINCEAQAALGNIGGGNSGNGTPVAKFGKVFVTQPFNSDTQNYLYGEMTGLVDQLNDSVVLLNQVQLYR